MRKATPEQLACPHENFDAKVIVNRLETTDKDNRLVDTGTFTADVIIHCADCKLGFRFLGCEAGTSFQRPMVSIDGKELRAPIEPANVETLTLKARFEAFIPKTQGN